MPVHSKLLVHDRFGEKVCTYKTRRFGGIRRTRDIENFLAKKPKLSRAPYIIEILDSDGGFVTLDDEYLEDYDPFNSEDSESTNAQVTKSPNVVTLKIRLLGNSFISIFPLFYIWLY